MGAFSSAFSSAFDTDYQITGGVVCGGVAYWRYHAPNTCPCNTYSEITTGGVLVGGEAVIPTWDGIGGGVLVGGEVVISCTGVYDNFLFCYPLDDASYPYQDHAKNLDSTGGIYPTAGAFGCTPAQIFANQYIKLPLDNYSGNFTISMFARFDGFAQQRCFFNRGGVFSLGYSYINHLMAIVIDAEGVEHTIFSDDILERNTWYHVAATWDGTTITLYVNGVEQGSEAVDSIGTPTGNNYIGRWGGGNTNCGLCEIRMVADCKDANYLLTEYENQCGDLVLI